MWLSCDPTGFPLLSLPALRLDVSLWPCTKAQFERFLSEPESGFGDGWYEEVLAVNPRVSWREAPSPPERLFLTGIYPEEALSFARWMGAGFDLPTVSEWRAAEAALAGVPIDRQSTSRLKEEWVEEAGAAFDHLRKLTGAKTWGGLTLSRGGVVEWVREGRAFGGLGTPRPGLLPNIYNPQLDVWHPARRRLDYLGFRLIRRWPTEREEDL